MPNVIHFNMIVEINQLLKEAGYDYTMHSVGGCTCCGVRLRCFGKQVAMSQLINLINAFLKDKFMYVEQSDYDEQVLDVMSLFDYEKKEDKHEAI